MLVVTISDLVPPPTAIVISAESLYLRSVLFNIFVITGTGRQVQGRIRGGQVQEDEDITHILIIQRRRFRQLQGGWGGGILFIAPACVAPFCHIPPPPLLPPFIICILRVFRLRPCPAFGR